MRVRDAVSFLTLQEEVGMLTRRPLALSLVLYAAVAAYLVYKRLTKPGTRTR